jgi:hypothetical protein
MDDQLFQTPQYGGLTDFRRYWSLEVKNEKQTFLVKEQSHEKKTNVSSRSDRGCTLCRGVSSNTGL